MITFILSGLAVLLIAILTVSYQAVKAARSNPVDALRYEWRTFYTSRVIMNLAIFDIDGTLLQTNQVDGSCYDQAL